MLLNHSVLLFSIGKLFVSGMNGAGSGRSIALNDPNGFVYVIERTR